MKTNRSIKFRLWILAFLVLLLFSATRSANAAWIGSEGDEWLKWDTNTRETYLRAYVQGMRQGYGKGCDNGIAAAQPHLKYDDATRTHQECWNHFPISAKDSDRFAASITKFYSAYPQQRFLYISDVLLELHAGRSIEQIHGHFPQSNAASQGKE